VSQQADDVDDANPFIANRFGSTGDACAREIPGARCGMVRLRPQHVPGLLCFRNPNWRAFLAKVIREEVFKLLRAREQSGRPLGGEELLATLEDNLGRNLRRQKPGPKRTRGS
jgi:hypothetical protein